MKNRLNIFITDDHATTRVGLKQILDEALESVFFDEASSIEATLQKLDEDLWDLLILDISLPDGNGLNALGEIKQKYPQLPVLIFSVHPEEQFAIRALKLGASGYMTKERAPEELPSAVLKILNGEHYITPAMAGQMARQLDRCSAALPYETLSNREFQVLCQIASGVSGKVCAAELGLSEKTVSTYRTRLLKKLNLTTTAELIQYAIRNQLVN